MTTSTTFLLILPLHFNLLIAIDDEQMILKNSLCKILKFRIGNLFNQKEVR